MILYLIVDQRTVQAVTAAIQQAIVETGRSDDGSVVVILLKANAWIAAVDAVNEIVPVMFSDKTDLDHNTIDLVVQLADWCLRPDK